MAEVTNAVSSTSDFLTDDNYYVWECKTKAVLESEDLWTVIDGPEPARGQPGTPAEADYHVWDRKNRKARTAIMLRLSSSQIEYVIGLREKSAKDTWDTLRRIHLGNIEDRRIEAASQLENLEMGDDESVRSYIRRARCMKAKCDYFGQDISERHVVGRVVKGLHRKFASVAAVLKHIRSATLDEVQQSLLEEETEINAKRDMVESKPVNKVEEGWDEQHNCTSPQKKENFTPKITQQQFRGVSNESQQSRMNVGSKDKRFIIKGLEPRTDQSDFSTDHAYEQAKAFSDDKEENQTQAMHEQWRLHFSYLSHMSPRHEWLEDAEPVRTEITIGSGRSMEAEAVGKVRLKILTQGGKENELCLNDVLYVPQLDANVISASRLYNEGYTIKFDEEAAKIYNKLGKLVAAAFRQNYAHYLPVYILKKECYVDSRMPQTSNPATDFRNLINQQDVARHEAVVKQLHPHAESWSSTTDNRLHVTESETRMSGMKQGEEETLSQKQASITESDALLGNTSSSSFDSFIDDSVKQEPDPKSYKEAIDSMNSNRWIDSMKKEVESLTLNQVGKLVDRTSSMIVKESKWIFTTKKNPDNTFDEHKARLVLMNSNQHPGVDSDGTYFPVMKLQSVRTLVAIASHLKLRVHQCRVDPVYLHGDLKKPIYMEQPEGFIDRGNENKVWELQKILYGLLQSSPCWNEALDKILTQVGLKRLRSDSCIYFAKREEKLFILGVFVDDNFVAGSDDEIVDHFMGELKGHIIMAEDKNQKEFLGINVQETETGFELSQVGYIQNSLSKFGLADSKPVKTPGDPQQDLDVFSNSPSCNITDFMDRMCVLLRLSVYTRPDIAYIVNRLLSYIKDPREIHMTAAKRVFRYLKGTLHYKLIYTREEGKIEASTDANWHTEQDAKSYAGYTVKLGSSLISWRSQKQKVVALSTCEAELMAIVEGVKELKWMLSVLSELEMQQYIRLPLVLKSDSQAAIDWIHSDGPPRSRTKHMNIKVCYVRDEVKAGNIRLEFVPSEDMEADMLTKSLGYDKLNSCISKVGLCRD